jgi:hypothetical protein
MRWLLGVLALGGCSDVYKHPHAFVAPASCGQGPYDVRLHTDGKTGGDGVEIVACTPHRLAGHVELEIGAARLANQSFGDVAENARCVAAGATVVTTAPAGASRRDDVTASGGGTATAATTLVERPWARTNGRAGDYTTDELCAPGLVPQVILHSYFLEHAPGELDNGADIHVRIWSDAPNDLERVVFMIVHETSKKTKQQIAKERAKREERARKDAEEARQHPPPPRTISDGELDRALGDRRDTPASAPPTPHGPPPAPLAEQQPARPPGAAWVPGYWTWTGTAWGWIAGFWRDARVATPAPRIEVPGAPPAPHAVWIVGAWQLRGGAWVWVGGRWGR